MAGGSAILTLAREKKIIMRENRAIRILPTFNACLQIKDIRMRPHIGAVVADEDRNVADNMNALGMASLPQRIPLLKKCELDNAFNLQLFPSFLADLLQHRRIAPHQLARPTAPARGIVALAQHVEENKPIEPVSILRTEATKAFAIFGTRILQKVSRGFLSRRCRRRSAARDGGAS